MNSFLWKYDINENLGENLNDACWRVLKFSQGSGRAVFKNGQEEIEIVKNRALLIPPFTAYALESYEPFSGVGFVFGELDFPSKFPCYVDFDEGGVLEKVFDELEKNATFEKAKIVFYLEGLSAVIAGSFATFGSLEKKASLVDEIRKNINKNYSDANYRLDEYLKSLPKNPDYLRKLFKKEVGSTPSAYLLKVRINNAKRLLSATAKNGYLVGEVASLCGFSDQLYFSRVFKKEVGSSPLSYAKRFGFPSKKKAPVGMVLDEDIGDDEPHSLSPLGEDENPF